MKTSYWIIFCLFIGSVIACKKGYYSAKNYEGNQMCFQCPYPCLQCTYFEIFPGDFSFICNKYDVGFTSSGIPICNISSAPYFDGTDCVSNCKNGCQYCSRGDYSRCTSCSVGYVKMGNGCISLGDLLIVIMTFLILLSLVIFGWLFMTIRNKRKSNQPLLGTY